MSEPRRTAVVCIAVFTLVGAALAGPAASTSDGDDPRDLTVVAAVEGVHLGPFCSTDIDALGTFDLDRSIEEDEDSDPARVAWTITYTIEAACGTGASRCEGTHPYPEGLRNVDATCPLGVFHLSSLELDPLAPCPPSADPAPATCQRATFEVWIEQLGRLVFHSGSTEGVAIADGGS